MESRFYLIDLYDIYGELLTEKQQEYFEDYYFNNLTLAEISENNDVSRNAIHKQIKETCEKLNYYESILKLKEKKERLEQLSVQITDEKLKEEIRDLI